MNETFEPYVKKLLDGGMKTAEDVAKFIEVQTPELGKEIITWGAASEVVAPLFGLLVVAVTSWFHVTYCKQKWYCEECGDGPPVAIFNIVVFILGAVTFSVQIMDVLYPLIAPRLYVLEKISSLIK